MALSDSMFLFEIIVEDLENFMRCKEFSIKSQFVDVFTLDLKNPNDFGTRSERKLIESRQKSMVRKTVRNTTSKIKLQTGRSVLIANSVKWLTTHMKKHPLILSLWSKKYPRKKFGEVCIPWKKTYIAYLNHLDSKQEQKPVIVNGKYSIFNESKCKCMAYITLSVKLTYLKGADKAIDSFLSPLKDFNELDNIKKADNASIFFKKCNNACCNKESYMRLSLRNEENRDNLLKIVKSDPQIDKIPPITILRCKSLSSIYRDEKLNPLTYIFGCPKGRFGNRVYCVSYFTVENDVSGKRDSPEASIKEVDQPKGRYHLKLCDSQCPKKQNDTGSCSQSVCSLDLPEEAGHLVNITKCKEITCDGKKHREPSTPPDDRILLDLTNVRAQCCNFTEKIEEVVGGITGKMKIGDDPCYCTCECTFGFTKKTTYCTVCGGYEIVGEELVSSKGNQMPFPCPIFHKLVDKNKIKNWSTSGSDSKRKGDDQSVKSMKVSSGQKAASSIKRQTLAKSVESEKDTKKGMKKKDDRFKFNYGYKGIPPQIGHSECAMPCTGTLGSVPKNMGWLWTAANIPGMKFRPMWKPGAVNKHVLRLLRIAKNPGEVISKKRRKDAGKKKRPLKRPLLIVHKKDGEYTVTMETMKTYTKPRAPNQHPYEEKPVLTYTIGRTDEENRDRQKKREREQRRLERAQRQFIQSAFRDVCQDICLKTYQQALGILPGAEDPECPCFTPQSKKANADVSCSCSEENSSIGSDTDLDEWIVEFTPPTALFDPTYKCKKVLKADVGTQYTYLDYRVKLVDRFGNPVPRFFKGPDGKQQCSDLGGFWSPDHKWLEINVDGYIAPDERWAPNNFIGPGGEQVDAETGKFQATNGKWLVVGVDGYVDCVGKWRPYPKPRGTTQAKRRAVSGGKKGGAGDRKTNKIPINYKPSETGWSCFGDASPKHLSRMGIIGHGQDKKLLLSALKTMIAHGENVTIPQPSVVYRLPASKKSKAARIASRNVKMEDEYKCHHPMPTEKGIVAVDEYGNKTYFRLKDIKNKRPKERLAHLADQGISVKHGWKPGAISKRLLIALNKAKLRHSVIERIETRKVKKRLEEKPTLIVCKKDGQYRIEMNAASNTKDCKQYTPLMYQVESANNKAKIKKRDRKQRRLIRSAIEEIWNDPYHPENCERICTSAYQRAIGADNCIELTCDGHEEKDMMSCSCSDLDDISSCSSSDIDWEIQFSPPSAFQKHISNEANNDNNLHY